MPTSHQCPTMHLVEEDTYACLAEALDFLQPDSVLACVGCGLASSILVANLEANGSGNDNLSDLGLPIQPLTPAKVSMVPTAFQPNSSSNCSFTA